MHKRDISPIVVRFLMTVYCNQSYSFKWNHHSSATFPFNNGVRQGAVCSPVLFCVYIDGLLQRLEKAKIGCYIGSFYLGALCYANDLTLLAPTVDTMRSTLIICKEYADEHAITFFAKESKCIIFKLRSAATYVRQQLIFGHLFSIAGSLIDHVRSWLHLGNIFSDTENDCTNVFPPGASNSLVRLIMF
jgi:Reverse transcriptase (RNA-dependent DNA polymerase)